MVRDPDISTGTTIFLALFFAAGLVIGYSFTTTNNYTRLGTPNSTNHTCLDGQVMINSTFPTSTGKPFCMNKSELVCTLPQRNHSYYDNKSKVCWAK